jgi:CubicO group peptidase (beta-lactamase class C family)
MILRSLIVLTAGALLALDGFCQADPEASDLESKSRQVGALFDSIAGVDAPGAAVLVARNGTVLHVKGYGFANIEHHVPITPQTKFRLASVTKSFTAAAVLRLQEAGELNIDDPVAKYLPDTPNGGRITLRHLLTHTSGIRNSEKDPLEFGPGERLNYSNAGYHLLGRIIEKVTGMPYEDYLRTSIFEPLKMHDSGLDHYAPIIANRAAGYDRGASGGYLNALPGDMADVYAGGGLYSTVEDLHRFDQAFITGKLLKTETVAAAFTPVRLNDGMEGSYGFGWIITKYGGLREISHGGDGTGCNTWNAYYPDQGISVIVLSNVGMRPAGPFPNAVDLAHKIADIYLGDQMRPENRLVEIMVALPVLQRYTGVYRIEGRKEVLDVMGDTITFGVEDGRLVVFSPKMPKAVLCAESETSFFVQQENGNKVAFTRDAQGLVIGVVIHLMGVVELRGERVDK